MASRHQRYCRAARDAAASQAAIKASSKQVDAKMRALINDLGSAIASCSNAWSAASRETDDPSAAELADDLKVIQRMLEGARSKLNDIY